MCGIAGFETRGEEAEAEAALFACLDRRGPDGRHRRRRGRFALLQTRLAVIDTSPAVQYPLPNETEDVWLLFNGEVYNHQALREDLHRRGHSFRTRCDAEVIVHAYEEWGADAFGRLDGMFALAILDEPRDRILLARDRFGIKPLVRTTSSRFAFASDAMALVSAGLSAGAIDDTAIRDFLTFLYVPPPRTGVADIVQVRPGTVVIRDFDGREEEQTFAENPFDTPDVGMDAGDAESAVDDALAGAVRRQLVADVDVGLLLSSGIDSALLLSYAVAAGASPRAFTLSFSGHGDYDETPAAAILARAYGIPHEMETFSMAFPAAVAAVANAYDQPFADSSALPTLQVSALARKSVTVVLSGTGGDELFGGYYRLRAHRLRPALAALDPVLKRLGPESGARGGERASLPRLAASYLGRLAEADSSDAVSQYLSLVARGVSPIGEGLLRRPFDRSASKDAVAALHGLGLGDARVRMRELQAFELKTFLPGDLLTKEDKATMAVGLEGRVPFLDEGVARAAAAIPGRRQASLLQGKRILRSLAEKRLSAVQLPRAKRGFAVPLAELFQTTWRSDASEWFRAHDDSAIVDGAALAAGMQRGSVDPTDAWALSALVGWESRLARLRGGGVASSVPAT